MDDKDEPTLDLPDEPSAPQLFPNTLGIMLYADAGAPLVDQRGRAALWRHGGRFYMNPAHSGRIAHLEYLFARATPEHRRRVRDLLLGCGRLVMDHSADMFEQLAEALQDHKAFVDRFLGTDSRRNRPL